MAASSNIPEQFKKGYQVPFQTQERAPGAQRPLNPKPLDDITADGKPYKASGSVLKLLQRSQLNSLLTF
jgi:hypothetical protein